MKRTSRIGTAFFSAALCLSVQTAPALATNVARTAIQVSATVLPACIATSTIGKSGIAASCAGNVPYLVSINPGVNNALAPRVVIIASEQVKTVTFIY